MVLDVDSAACKVCVCTYVYMYVHTCTFVCMYMCMCMICLSIRGSRRPVKAQKVIHGKVNKPLEGK